MEGPPSKILVVGLDAADWKVIDPLLAEGRLPTLRALLDRGARAALESIEPYLSPVVWTSIFSGKMPDKHGVVDFFATSHSVKVKRLWDVLGDHGWSVGLFEVMATWPARPVDGFWIPDTFARDTQTFPRELSFVKELANSQKLGSSAGLRGHLRDAVGLVRFGARPGTLAALGGYVAADRAFGHSMREAYYRKRALKTRLFADFFQALHRRYRPRFSAFYTNLIDATSHMYWRYHEPEAFPDVSEAEVRRYGGYVAASYELCDGALRDLLGLVGPRDHVVVLSDHGSRAMLEDRYETYRLKTERFLAATGLAGEVHPAYVGSSLLLRPRRDTPETREAVIAGVQAVRLRRSGREEALLQAAVDYEHYIHVKLAEGVRPSELRGGTALFPSGAELPIEELLETTGTAVSGTHDPFGILVLVGPGVRRGTDLGEHRIVDVTPTLLHLAGLPVAKDMDGEVLAGAFSDRFLAHRPVEYVDSYEPQVGAAAESTDDETGLDEQSEEEIMRRLESLGYI